MGNFGFTTDFSQKKYFKEFIIGKQCAVVNDCRNVCARNIRKLIIFNMTMYAYKLHYKIIFDTYI